MIKLRHREDVLPINSHNTNILNDKLSTKVSLIPKSMLLITK